MADRGYRSIEVTLTNDTRGDLTLLAATGLPPSAAWINAETATSGTLLPQYNTMELGVMTSEATAAAGASIELTGLGSFPIQIEFLNNAAGISNCIVSPNDAVQAITTPIHTGEPNHTQYEIQLIPAMPPHTPAK